MNYLLRLMLLTSAVFFLSYVSLSGGLAAAWLLLRKRAENWEAWTLYGLRIAPLAIAIAAVGFLIIPSFLYLEPLGTGESLSLPAVGLAFGGVFIVVAGALSGLLACWKTARFVSGCQRTRQLRIEGSEKSAIVIAAATPVLVVAGAYEPKLLISEGVSLLLEPAEMQAAMQHELAHVKRRDNLKKLILRGMRFPFLKDLERSWLQAAEFAADDAAATNESAALDLASALLKIAGQPPAGHLPELAMSLVPNGQKALRSRVERLLEWKPRNGQCKSRAFLWAPLAVSCAVVLALSYGPLLRQMHELTELLAR